MSFVPNDAFSTDGYLCLDEVGASLLAGLDRAIVRLADAEPCTHYQGPSVVSGEVLAKCGYFESHPHHLHALASIGDDGRAALARGSKLTDGMFSRENLYLIPAVCIPIYPAIARLELGEGKIFTTVGRAYRAEDRSYAPLTRQREFTLREFILAGTKSFVVDRLETFRERALALARSFAPDARIEVASDHFYPSQFNDIKTKIQVRNTLKHELQLHIDGKPVAVGSFNFHHHHFSRAFGFDRGGSIVTGCVGFGLERMVAACLGVPGAVERFKA